MKQFVKKTVRGEMAHLSHFEDIVLPELEGLYSTLQPQLQQGNPFVYIASTQAGEGTSSIARALCYFIAMRENAECLYVDGNLANPSIRLQDSFPEFGLTDFLLGSEDYQLLPFQTELDKVAAIHAGRAGGTYVKLASDRITDFIDQSKLNYRVTIFDAKPGFDKFTEAWAPECDATIIVTSYRKTKREVLDRMLKGLAVAQVDVTGFVFNKKEYPIPGIIYRRI